MGSIAFLAMPGVAIGPDPADYGRVLLLADPDFAQENIGIFSYNSVVAPNIIEAPVSVFAKLPPMNLKKYGDGWCVSYAKHLSGLEYSGSAWRWKEYVNSQIPEVGAVVVLREGRNGHLAVVIAYQNDTIAVSEQNYIGRYIISERELPIDYPAIVGYVIK